MRIQADTSHLQNNLALQHPSGDAALKQKQALLAPQTPSSLVPSSSRTSSKEHPAGPYASYRPNNINPYHQAIRAYQEASRFENDPTVPLSLRGNPLGEGARGNEAALTDILREEPNNSAAWYDLGLLYATRGDRNKVSAVYQVLQKVDSQKAEHFSTSVGLQEKYLLDVV